MPAEASWIERSICRLCFGDLVGSLSNKYEWQRGYHLLSLNRISLSSFISFSDLGSEADMEDATAENPVSRGWDVICISHKSRDQLSIVCGKILAEGGTVGLLSLRGEKKAELWPWVKLMTKPGKDINYTAVVVMPSAMRNPQKPEVRAIFKPGNAVIIHDNHHCASCNSIQSSTLCACVIQDILTSFSQ